MAIYRYLTVSVFIFVSLCVATLSEIHRTKSNPSKSLNRRKATQADSYVAMSQQNGGEFNATDGISEDMLDRIEVWCFSIFGAILVGLSGIFPLLVIPIEAGPSLKHGGGSYLQSEGVFSDAIFVTGLREDQSQKQHRSRHLQTEAAAAKLKLLLSFAVGGLLGDVFLHLLPEAWEHLDKDGHDHQGHMRIGLWVIAGMLSFLIIEKAFAEPSERDHLEDDEDGKKKIKSTKIVQGSDKINGVKLRTKNNNRQSKSKTKKNGKNSANNHINDIHIVPEKQAQGKIKVTGYLNLAANVIDNFTHGLAVAGGFLVSKKVGLVTTVAILLHEIPHEVGDFAILLRSGFDRWKAAKAQLLTATGGTVGALTALMADSAQEAGDSTVWILPFTSGGFLYIALVTVVPDLLEEKQTRESIKQIICLLCGIGVMYLVSMVH